ncbi:DUF4332 domain-containing protein [Zhongshania borealis]|uniref:DUF4332 domain-containing protein n=1 Tax=Zhongshania borealis TaxID=889488 RepID=A0ABP7X2C4_9GAMM
MTKLSEIEGIGEAYSSRLVSEGISSIEALLENCGAKTARKNLAEKSGISEKRILNWVNRADLARINGVSTQYADLLESAGVDTVPELAQRNAENLHKKMAERNEEVHLVRKVPALSQVQSWIDQAKDLPRKITH